MDRTLLAYGLTTSVINISTATVAHVTMSPQVVARFLYPVGATLLVGGVSTVTGLAQVPADGMLIPGPADLYLLAGGATVGAHIHTYLSQGFTGAAIPTP